MTSFWRIGNYYVNPAHIISVRYRPAVSEISGPDDPRVIAGEARWSKHDEVWTDDDGEIIRAKTSRLTVTTTALVAGDTAVSDEIVIYGHEADSFDKWLDNEALFPTVPEPEEGAHT